MNTYIKINHPCMARIARKYYTMNSLEINITCDISIMQKIFKLMNYKSKEIQKSLLTECNKILIKKMKDILIVKIIVQKSKNQIKTTLYFQGLKNLWNTDIGIKLAAFLYGLHISFIKYIKEKDNYLKILLYIQTQNEINQEISMQSIIEKFIDINLEKLIIPLIPRDQPHQLILTNLPLNIIPHDYFLDIALNLNEYKQKSKHFKWIDKLTNINKATICNIINKIFALAIRKNIRLTSTSIIAKTCFNISCTNITVTKNYFTLSWHIISSETNLWAKNVAGQYLCLFIYILFFRFLAFINNPNNSERISFLYDLNIPDNKIITLLLNEIAYFPGEISYFMPSNLSLALVDADISRLNLNIICDDLALSSP